jgi:hypothetical protein
VTEALRGVMDGTIIELRPRMLRKRWKAALYGRGAHAVMRTPLEEAIHVTGVVVGVVILVAGMFAAAVLGL